MSTTTNDIRLRDGALDEIKAEHEITSDAELARRLNLAAPTLSQIRSGRRGPGVAFIVGAYKAFGITVEDYPESIYEFVTEAQE